MGYVQDNIMPGEQVVYSARLSWAIFIKPAAIFVLGLFLFSIGNPNAKPQPLPPQVPSHVHHGVVRHPIVVQPGFIYLRLARTVGVLLILLGGAIGFERTLVMESSEYVITTKRLVLKVGAFRRRTVETLLNQIETLSVEQNVLGDWFNYGTLMAGGTGGTREPFQYCHDPMEFRKRLYQQIEADRAPQLKS